jgi:preprotein translocase subunit YajC
MKGIRLTMKTYLAVIITIMFFAVTACAQKRMSDRDADGLKGKVQKVVTESAKLTNESGNWVEAKRQMNSVVIYDAEGNRMKREGYDYRGNLFQINEYSFIDGDKVVRMETIRHEYDPPAVAVAPSTNKENAKPSDPRYTYKFKYKYDDKGNRTEEAWYHNDGSLWLRYVSVYDDKGNEVEWFRYTGDGKVNGRSVSSYDAKGSVVEKNLVQTGRVCQ